MDGYVIVASNVASRIKWYFDSSEKSLKIQGSRQQQKNFKVWQLKASRGFLSDD